MGGAIKRLLTATVATVMLALGVAIAFHPALTQAQDGRDCDSNAVIMCGALSISELKQKFQANSGNLQVIYSQFGINSVNDFNGMVMGRVTTNNQVFVGNTLVATNAITAGRQNMPGSTPIAGGAFMRPPSVSFANKPGSLDALVKMSGGTFQFAVITSCGNPVKAHPVKPPPPPKPKVPNFEINKEVKLSSQTEFVKDVTAKNNEIVDFRVTIKNTGETELQNVIFHDVLPAGLTAVPNTFSIDGITTKGDFTVMGTIRATIGRIALNGQTIITFSTKVDSNVVACGETRLVNEAFALPPNLPEKSSQASVQVCREVIKTVTVIKQAPPVVKEVVTPAPTVLPNTGAGDVFTLFGLISISGALWFKFIFPLVKGLTL